jgi:AcrR family transcriptional regulator
MNNTRKNILNASKVLFNELGYSQVTIRMIALQLKMSSGNLNYHFKKREHILEALYFEMVEVFDQRINQLDEKSSSLCVIKQEIQGSMTRMMEYQFFWTDLFNLLKQNDNIRKHFEEAYQNRIKGHHFLFKMLRAKNLLQAPTFINEHQFLIERMLDYSNTWLYASLLYEQKEMNAAYIEHQANILLSMYYPYLTDLGKEEFQKLIPEYFE